MITLITLSVLAWPIGLACRILRAKKITAEVFLLAATLSFAMYMIGIGIPYYFQGYSALKEALPGEGMGWTKNFIVGTFAYFYTSNSLGLLWLSTGMLLAAFGGYEKNKMLSAIAKIILVLGFAWLLFEFHKFHATINMVLE